MGNQPIRWLFECLVFPEEGVLGSTKSATREELKMDRAKCFFALILLIGLLMSAATGTILSCGDDDDDNDDDDGQEVDDDDDADDDADDDVDDDVDDDADDDSDDDIDDDTDDDANDDVDDDVDDDTAPTDYALEFDGIDDYVDVANSVTLNLSPPLTIEGWIYVEDATGPYRLINKYHHANDSDRYGWAMALEDGNILFFIRDDEAKALVKVESPNSITLDTWIHVAVTYDGSNLKLWIDGLEVDSIATSLTIPVSTVPLRIGSSCTLVKYLFPGAIDEVRISNTIRYDSSFTPEMEFALDGLTTALWHFDEGSGTTATDESGNDNDGTVIGPTWVER
jgi:Concanavalin A-like lectin/glucanases superfamily